MLLAWNTALNAPAGVAAGTMLGCPVGEAGCNTGLGGYQGGSGGGGSGGDGSGGGRGGNGGGGDSGGPTPPTSGLPQGNGPTFDSGPGSGSAGSLNNLLGAGSTNKLLAMRMSSIFSNPVAFLQEQMLAFQGGLKRGPEATADGCAPLLYGLCDSFDEIKNSFTNFLGTLSTGSSYCLVGCVGVSVSEGTPYLSIGGIGFGGLTKASLSTSQAPVSEQGPWQGVAGGAFDGGGGVTVGPEDPSSGNTIAWGEEGMTGEGWQVGVNVYIPISLDPNTWEQWFQSWSW